MTQLNIFAHERSDASRAPRRDLWFTGALILAIVFVPAAIAALLSLFSH